ncbi:MAG: GMC family oxidoreductase [Deltaproteobacteria bacterium]|jgi:choline dehydrogenase-like flavoprotein|nr:GMC family oxidoreductase [Deltaproteobacteria bacterium]MBW2533341.1 GMC family oxidoreductase [Deltaproteobacteria bacterium]
MTPTTTQGLGPLPTATDPHDGVREFADYGDLVRDRCDVLVVGSGPGGAVAAKELAEAGRDVILLEEGPPCGKQDFDLEPGKGMQRWFREGSARAARGNMLTPTMQPIALGGGSVFNSAICARPPAWVLDRWADKLGSQALTLDSLAPHYERVEAQLSIGPTPVEVQGKRNLLFKRGCDELGITSEPTPRNVAGCRGSAECFSGCRNGAKKSLDVTYVPAAIRAGARVYSCVRAERVLTDGRRATGMRGRVIEPFTLREHGRVHIDAKAIVLAAGCMATPVILLRSGVANSGGAVGRHLQFHPGIAVMAIYAEPIDPWTGATQGYHSLHYLKQGMKLEVLWVPPGVLATRMPGVGIDYQRHLMRFGHLAPYDVIIQTKHSTGRVALRPGSWHPDIRFHMDQRDVDLLRRGAALLSDVCWASGAEAILPGINGMPELIESRDEAEVIRKTKMKATDPIIASNHAFSSTRMSRNPKEGVVDVTGRCHDLDNVYIADTGIFPDSPAVNPMHTCMALADYIAQNIAAQW